MVEGSDDANDISCRKETQVKCIRKRVLVDPFLQVLSISEPVDVYSKLLLKLTRRVGYAIFLIYCVILCALI